MAKSPSLFLKSKTFYRFLFSACLFSVAASSPVVAQTEASFEKPVAEASVKTFNFGRVSQGKLVEKSFSLKNSGNAPLKIEGVHADCGCTAAKLKKKTLSPGESTDINITFDTDGFSGEKKKSVRVYTNDPLNRSISFSLSGRIISEVEVSPRRVSFKNLDLKSIGSSKKRLRVNLERGKNLKVLSASSRSPHVLIEKIGEQDFEISLDSTTPSGVFKSNISIKTTSKDHPIVTVPVFAVVRGALYFEPVDLSFGLLEGPLQSGISKTARLVNSSGKKITIKSIEADEKKYKVSWQALAGTDDLEVTVELKEGLIGNLHKPISLLTDYSDESQNSLELPVFGIISKKGS